MKKGSFLLFIWYATIIVFVFLAAILPLLKHSLLDVSLWIDTEQFLFTLLLLVFSIAFFLYVLVQTAILVATQGLRQQLRSILQNKSIRSSAKEDSLLMDLSEKVMTLTRQVQLIDNQDLVKKEEIVEGERKRIARDLHDTVSQGLFASSMILSGLTASVGSISEENMKKQLETVKQMVETAQRDLRILLLHLRPSELESKSLIEGFELILNEVRDKSAIEVYFQHDIDQLPKYVEEHLFRIAQEIISNTLRHAHAKRLDVYLIQTEYEVQLKMTDDGVGFVQEEEQDLSYGLQNIRERVEDMAGTIKLRTAPNKGVAIDIRIPILKGKEDETDSRDAG
ncbi:sensor histidine kinase [Streptococcus cameli]